MIHFTYFTSIKYHALQNLSVAGNKMEFIKQKRLSGLKLKKEGKNENKMKRLLSII